MKDAQSFSLSPARWANDTEALRREIEQHTQNAEATSRILSSIVRFGADPSILRFEMIPVQRIRTSRLGGLRAWTVRAVRPEPPTSAS